MGLTPKEKHMVLATCQRRTGRYLELKALASNAMNNHKVYVVYGPNMAIRKALNSRGWVEKIPPQNMNLNKIYRPGATKDTINNELERLLLSNLVEKHIPNFMWKIKDFGRQAVILNENHKTIINKLKMDTVWATKLGLCSSIKNNHWFHIDGVAETHLPRTYDSKEDIEDFTNDFMLTACTSLLKWILHMADTKKSIHSDNGKVSKNILTFSFNRCKEYVLRKQNKDVNHGCYSVSARTWAVYLSSYYKLISEEELFEEFVGKKITLYNAYAKILLIEMEKYRPQIKCEGFQNLWIVKPGHCCRGRGIKLASKLTDINSLLTSSQRKVIQKYIEKPLLIHETKFDIRQYYLVTSTFPLVIWMYKDCYLKFSSQKYTLGNYDESVHLTNNAVQKKYRNCSGRHSELPSNNMWCLKRYKKYLRANNKRQVWDQIIYPNMKKTIIGVMLSSQDHMSPCKNRFELYGCDFVLDEDYIPWLIEINSCPDLNPTTKVTAKICPAVVEDIVKVVIDHPNSVSSDTGKFECAYRQPITNPIYCRPAELVVIGRNLPNEYFWKSSIEHAPFDSTVNIDKECDIHKTFKILKDLHEQEADKKEANKWEEVSDLEIRAISSKLILLESSPSTPTGSNDSIEFITDSSSSSDDDSTNQTSEDNSLKSYYSEINLKESYLEPKRHRSPSSIQLDRHYAAENVAKRIIHNMSQKISMVEHSLINHFKLNKPADYRVCKEQTNSIISNVSNTKTNTPFPTAASIILSYISQVKKM